MQQSTLQPLVSKLTARSMLEQHDIDALMALPHTLKTFTAGSYLVREGDRAKHTCILLDGFAYRQKTTADGSRQIVGVQIPGDPVDLHNSMLHRSDHNVQALTTGAAALVRREDILEIVSRFPSIAHALWIDTLVDGSIAREWIVNVGRRSARARLAHMLCEFAVRVRVVRLEQGEAYELPMTQEQIGDVLGLTTVHVNRMVRAFEIDGLIRRTNRTVVLLEPSRLEAIAGFNDMYLHLDQSGDDQGKRSAASPA